VLGTNGEPLAGASLSLATMVPHQNGSTLCTSYQDTITDALGRFTMERIPPGSHVLYYPSPTYDGLAPPSVPAKGVCGALVIEKKDGERIDELVLDLSQSTAVVEGCVFAPDGKPLPGTTVFLDRYHVCHSDTRGCFAVCTATVTGPHRETITDEQGRYKLTGIGPGQWSLGRSSPRFQRFASPQIITLAAGQTLHKNIRVTERNDEDNRTTRAAAEAERTDDLAKLEMACSGNSLMANSFAWSDAAFFLELSSGHPNSCLVQLKSLGLPRTAKLEEIASAAHAGELYFDAPDNLVTVNGTIVARATLPRSLSAGDFLCAAICWLQKIKRAEIVALVEASRRQNPDADGRHIAIKEGNDYIVVRSDGQGYLMHIDSVGKREADVTALYLGHLQLARGGKTTRH
jgi:hypothetical protein